MNSKNTSNNIFESTAKNLTISFKQLFFKDKVDKIINKTRISHKKPEDIILSKNTAFIIPKKEEKSDKDILYELLLRSNKKQSEEDINKSIRILYDRGIDINLMKKLWRLSKYYFTDELEKKGFFDLFNIIFNEKLPYSIINGKIDEFNNELSKKVAKSKEETIFDIFFEEIHMLEIFNAKENLENISKLKKVAKSKSIDSFYINYKKQLDTLALIPDKIKECSKKYDLSILSNDIIIKSLILDIKEEFLYLSKEQRIDIIKKIEIYLNIRRDIIYYLENSEYNNNHKKILADIYRISQEKLKGGVFCEDGDTSLIFYIQDEETFQSIYKNFSNSFNNNSISKIGGFYTTKNNIEISVINGTFLGNPMSEIIMLHEIRHSKNNIIIEDSYNDILTKAKDEIIAYLEDGYRNIDEIKEILIMKYDEGGEYDYYKIYKSNFEHYLKLRKYYEKDLAKVIEIARYMQKLDIPNYLEILSIVPVRKWDLLKKIYKKNDLLEVAGKRRINMIKIFGEFKNIY